MHTAYLLIGSNLGEREIYLDQAKAYLNQKRGKIVQQSAVYETAPWGIKEQPFFLNQAIALETLLTPEDLMITLLEIEEKMGRIRTVKFGPRTIDLDILLYNQIIMDSQLLKLPHPSLPERRFALTALAEIAPNFVHPILKKTIKALLLECTDISNVQKKPSKLYNQG